jgi:uncharacterized protein (DUF2237 family)
MENQTNILGGTLERCGDQPLTGFYRDGCCHTGPEDVGRHTVCAVMNPAFLAFSRSRGNDLSTPVPEYGFPGLQSGDRWCLCAARWEEAFRAGFAPLVVLEATNEAALEVVDKENLLRYAHKPANWPDDAAP